VAANCSVAGDNPRTVNVSAGATATTTFAVTCTALPPTVGTLEVVTDTSGDDVDPDGYTVTVDGGAGSAVGIIDTLTTPDLAPGDYEVALSDVAANCAVGGDNPRTVAVSAGATASTTFTVTCTALPPTVGTLEVVTDTSGDDLDSDGYTVTVDGGAGSAVGIIDTLTTPDLAPGDYEVALSDVAANCSVDGDNPRTVAVSAGATASTTFTVTCTALPPPLDMIVFARFNDGLWDIDADGTGATQLTQVGTDQSPDVSPDGATIAFSSQNGGTERDIFTVSSDGSNRIQLTDAALAGGESIDPEWSPDGSKIVFYSDRNGQFDIWVMDADGSNPIALTDTGDNAFPSWSPDGTQIVFASNRDGNFEIYVMNADGSDETRLTTTAAAELNPSFSPDGTRIAFDANRDAVDQDVYVMDADGTDPVRLTTSAGDDSFPAWSPDGLLLAFSSEQDGPATIWIMDADGSNQTQVSQGGQDFFATWTP
jgi:TolB protein